MNASETSANYQIKPPVVPVPPAGYRMLLAAFAGRSEAQWFRMIIRR
jgi:hypothetical protein